MLFHSSSKVTDYYWKSWEWSNLASVVVIEDIENYIHQEENTLVIESGTNLSPFL